MRAPRLFVAGPLEQAAEIALPAAAAQHVVSVLRLRPGAPLTLFDGRGGEWAANLVTTDRRSAQVRVGAFSAVDRESRLQVTLLQGIARGERMDQLVQKATELGVARIIPVATERSVVQLEGARAERRSAHWQAVAQSACEQCGRNRVPEVTTPLDLAAACGAIAATPLRWLLEPAAAQPLVAAAQAVVAPPSGPVAIALFIGPEGGLTDAELAQAARFGFQPMRLGPRVLRTETAGPAALAVLQAVAGDLAD
ncbi:MAG: 16S rRNA (uracil(1498)-N(3))-methyltransferase [Proteobacteria bacterium]|nr:16S rRNA (uracil(1498)-N(3))-methyltransferase [Pseudomonadota bacterium]